MTDPPEHPSILPQKQRLYHQLYGDYLQCCYLLTRYRQMWFPGYRALLADLDRGFFNMVGHVLLRELALGVYRQTEKEHSSGQLTVRNLFKWVNGGVDKSQLAPVVESAKKAGSVFRDVRTHALAHRESEKAGFREGISTEKLTDALHAIHDVHQFLRPEGVELSKELILQPFAIPHQLAQLARIAHFEAERIGLDGSVETARKAMDRNPEATPVIMDVHLAATVHFKNKPPENLPKPRMTWWGELDHHGRLKNAR